MPKPSTSDGPWGEAIRHLLSERQMSQADLVRLVNEPDLVQRYQGKIVQSKTVSKIVRGFPTQTRLLGRIADALSVGFDEVLVAPGRRIANEQRERMAQEITSKVLREMDARIGTSSISPIDDKSAELAARLSRLPSSSRMEFEVLIAAAERVESSAVSRADKRADQK